MAAPTKGVQKALEALAAELDTVSTWHAGPRAGVVQRLAKQARGIADGSVGAEEIEAVGNATTAAPQEGDKTARK